MIATIFLMMSIPGFIDKTFSLGGVTSEVSDLEESISKTSMKIESIEAISDSNIVNFTLTNDGNEKLWNYEKFNLIITYDGNVSGTKTRITEDLTFDGSGSFGVGEMEKTFSFDGSTESWTFSFFCSDPLDGTFTGSFDGGNGNPAGSLLSDYHKNEGSNMECSSYWEWTGSWEDLGVDSGAVVTSTKGTYDYEVGLSDVSEWFSGQFLLLDGSCNTIKATLLGNGTLQTGTVSWTTRSGLLQSLNQEQSSNPICLRVYGYLSQTLGGLRDWEYSNDNVKLTIRGFGIYSNNGWIIEGILEDIIDPKIINTQETATISSKLSNPIFPNGILAIIISSDEGVTASDSKLVT